jgi:hypothetical protein
MLSMPRASAMRRSIVVAALIASLQPAANGNGTPGRMARILATCVSASDCKVAGTLVLRGPGTSAEQRVPIVNGMAQLNIGQMDAAAWQATLEADGYWMPPQPLVAAAGGSWRVNVWRTTLLRGRFAVPSSAKELPTAFTLSLEAPPGITGTTVPRGSSIGCSVAPDGSWACPVPATPLDVVIRAKTFTPHYEWDLKLKPGAETNLGKIVLQRGSSLVAWLDSSTAKVLKLPAKASLTRMTMGHSPNLGERLSQPVAEGTFNRRGVVQLAPIAPGTYTLEVTAPGFAPARLDQITVYERSESALRTVIRLEAPLTIRLSVEPPRDPTGRAWRVAVDRSNPLTLRRSKVADGTLRNGSYEIAGQPPGRYAVMVMDRDRNIYADREWDIRSEAEAERTIEIAFLRLHGTLASGNQPIEAQMVFGGRNGLEQIVATADDRGVFQVILPHAGKWAVDIEGKDPAILAALSTTITEGQQELSLHLPDTEVGGWVTGLDGGRVAGASVTLYTSAGPVSRHSDGNGTFRFRGVSLGPARIDASDPRTLQHSRVVDVPVNDGLHRGDIELAFENMATLKGVAVSQGQPLVGARVTGYGLGIGMARQQRTVTGLDGGFELAFPAAAKQIGLIIAAPGRTLQAFSTLQTDRTVTFEIAPTGGLLRLRMAEGASRPGVVYNGAPIPMQELLEWGRAQGLPPSTGPFLSIPNVAPGSYRFCVAAQTGGDVCRDGTLAPGGTLLLGDE